MANVEGAARLGGFAATQGEKEKTKKAGNRTEIGPDAVTPISYEVGGRPGPQTVSVLQGPTTKLVEARGGELHAATTFRKLRLTLERTLMRAEADA